MNHYIAYHSTNLWGTYSPKKQLRFYSGKGAKYLRASIGKLVWVIIGAPAKGRTVYHLAGKYTPSHIRKLKSGGHDIFGTGQRFKPPIELNQFSWFSRLLREQGRFRFGFNLIKDKTVIAQLQNLSRRPNDQRPSGRAAHSTEELNYAAQRPEWLDHDLVALEGKKQIAIIQHRQREQWLRKAKIREAKMRNNGTLICEVPGCGFDFAAVYGELGRDYAQVHHLKPLSDRTAPSQTKLSDLAVVVQTATR